VIDRSNRDLVHWEICESRTEAGVEVALWRAKEKVPDGSPRRITNNGRRFIVKYFDKVVRISAISHAGKEVCCPTTSIKLKNSKEYPRKNVFNPRCECPLRVPEGSKGNW
jgi:hypothetical protein